MKEFRVACICALWCDACAEYRPGFEALAVRRGDEVLFYGVMLPRHELLRRLLKGKLSRS